MKSVKIDEGSRLLEYGGIALRDNEGACTVLQQSQR
jgi:hypothetical protein